MAPDWTQAPEWAQWWAVDNDGSAYWFEVEPFDIGVSWWETYDGRFTLADRIDYINIAWRSTLTQRPQEAR